jgi:3-deoxy-manno-octulosonate cytidylyltransferase (CMP-KDO synthetase)
MAIATLVRGNQNLRWVQGTITGVRTVYLRNCNTFQEDGRQVERAIETMTSVIEATRAVGLIPARLASSRLPNKPLADIHGWPMIRHVWERARQTSLLSEVAVATPDDEIARAVEAFGGRVIRTLASHQSGTDRLAEAATLLDLQDKDIVVNIQGDEPLLDPMAIEMVVRLLQSDREIPMSSLMCPCPYEDIDNPDCTKVVCAQNGDALYFSRARIPFPAKPHGGTVYQHIGLYAYRRYFLRMFANLPPTPLEMTESLEQLRVLEHGYSIRMGRIATAPIGVDKPEDLERVRALIGRGP